METVKTESPSDNPITSGPLGKSIWRLAAPAVGMMYLQALYNIIDTFWVGRVGPEALAGISTAGFVIWTVFALINVVSVGISATIARRVGEGDREEAGRVAYQGLLFAVITSIALGLLLLPSRGALFELMDTSEAVTSQGISYLTVMIYGISTLFLSFMFTAIFQAAGDTYTPMRLTLWTLLLNVALDPIMIFGLLGFPKMGIAGAALATVVSRTVFILWALVIFLRAKGPLYLRFDRWHSLDWSLYGKVVHIGVPPSLTGFFFSTVYMALTRYVSDFGDEFVAALRIGHMAEFVSFCTAIGFSVAASTIVGQNLGAGQPDRAKKAVFQINLYVTAILGVFTSLFLLFPEGIVSLFTKSDAVIAAGGRYLIILAASQIFMGWEIATGGAFSGAGNTVPPMVVSIPLTLFRIPLAWVLAYPLGIGIDGIWWSISATTILKALILVFWFSRGHWARKKV